MTTSRSAIAPVDDRIIYLAVELAVAPAEAFAHFTEPERLKTWLAEDAAVDADLGGRYELFWDVRDRENNSTIGCRITAFAEPELLAFQWRSPAQFKAFANAADPLTHVVVAFAPIEAGTRVHLVHAGWRDQPAWEEARRWQARAWTVALDRLKGAGA
jgi:uncharacterized protein YndB with AHSA1/START domain